MKKILPLLCALLLLLGCSPASPATSIEMELTEHYDTKDPFVHEKLFYVDKNIDTLELDIAFQMKGESGLLEILDNETKEVVWSQRWDGSTDKTTLAVSLKGLDKEKEYCIRFTGTKIKSAKVTVTSEESLIKEREKPRKPNKAK